MSRERVAWPTSKPLRSSRCWSESWLSTGPSSSRSRIALWRAVFDMNKNALECISIHVTARLCQAGNARRNVPDHGRHDCVETPPRLVQRIEARPQAAFGTSRVPLPPGSAIRDLEVYAMIVVGFAGGREIEVGKQDFTGATCAEIKERVAHDRVVEHVGLVAVFEHKNSRGLRGYGLFRFTGSRFAGSLRLRSRIAVRSAFGGSVRVPLARSANIVDVRCIVVSFHGVGNSVRNVDRLADADGEKGVIVVAVAASGEQRRVWICRQEKTSAAVSKNRPAAAVTVWPERRYAGTDTGIGVVASAETV